MSGYAVDHPDVGPMAAEFRQKLEQALAQASAAPRRDGVERGTGRLLGAQIVGAADLRKRIDVLAAAPWSRMTAAKVAGRDVSYAPPFSPVWDLVLLAAGRAAAKV